MLTNGYDVCGVLKMEPKLERKLIKEFPQLFQGCPTIMHPGIKGSWLRLRSSVRYFIRNLPILGRIITFYYTLKIKMMHKYNIPVKYKPIQDLMFFGCDCGDGWYNLLRSTCQRIMAALPNSSLDPENQKLVRFDQIKEKWGCLRIYYHPSCEELDDIVYKSEGVSATICEECGSIENVKTTTGWIKHLCPSCMDERTAKVLENFNTVVKMLEEE